MKRDYFFWIVFFILFILFYKLLELIWDNIPNLNMFSQFASRLIIIIIGFIISILLTDKIVKFVRKKQ